MSRTSRLLNRETALKVSKLLAAMDTIESETEISMRQFIELNFDKLQAFKDQGRTKRGVYNFLVKKCELDLGSYESFLYMWRQCAKKRMFQQLNKRTTSENSISGALVSSRQPRTQKAAQAKKAKCNNGSQKSTKQGNSSGGDKKA